MQFFFFAKNSSHQSLQAHVRVCEVTIRSRFQMFLVVFAPVVMQQAGLSQGQKTLGGCKAFPQGPEFI